MQWPCVEAVLVGELRLWQIGNLVQAKSERREEGEWVSH